VILVDINILVYATNADSREHPAAREWFDRQLAGPGRVGLPWHSLLGFLRLVTNPRVFPTLMSMADGWQQVESWLACESTWTPEPTERHTEVLGDLLALPGMSGNLVPDAHLAALAMEHGLTLCSTDGDFARFPKLRWENPLAT
jgi:toxin-antitoxin system PIN domain toxin